jgi:hypothetical protein
MNDLERLVAIEEIKQLKYRYYRFLDTRDWENFKTVWAPDGVLDVHSETRIVNTEEGLYRGPEVITAFARKAIGAGATIDHALMPEIEILSPATARAIWVQEDRVTWPEGSPNRSLHGNGYEHETYEKLDGKWLIKSSKLVRLKVKIERSSAAPV